MDCPVCADQTLVISSREGIEIDHCPQCRGVWLDRGELDKIIERAAPAVVGDTSRGAAAPPPPDDGDRYWRDRDRDRDRDRGRRDRDDDDPRRYQRYDRDDDDDRRRYPTRRRRKSFLEDLFDFD